MLKKGQYNMKPLTMQQFLSTYNNADTCLDNTLRYHMMSAKPHELNDFALLCQLILKNLPGQDIDGWFLDTDLNVVPDFDLLRFTPNSVINIELKHQKGNTQFEKIKNKFKNQTHILKLLDLQIYNIVFFADEKICYLYSENNFHCLNIKELISILEVNNSGINTNIIDNLSPKDYLISPIEDIDSFFAGKYYLTPDQQSIVSKITTTTGTFGIPGIAGSGKTLIAYDVLRKIDGKVNALFIFSGNLREKHLAVEAKFTTIKFIGAQYLSALNLDEYSIVLIDEAQRLHSSQRQHLIAWAQKNCRKATICFFYDCDQTLGPKDAGQLLSRYFETQEKEKKAVLLPLNDNLRSNKYIAAFVKQLRNLSKMPKSNIDLHTLREIIDIKYFKDANSAKPWINSLMNKNYTFLVPTGDNHNVASSDQFLELKNTNTHNIIGSELNNVVTYIDNSLEYSKQGLLKKNSSEYYFTDNELYVNLSRAREKLAVAVIDNIDVYNAIIEVIFNLKVQK